MRACMKAAALLAALVMAGPAFANSFGFPNEVVNGGFEDAAGIAPWEGNITVYDSGAFGVLSPEGERHAGGIANWGTAGFDIVQWVDNTKSPGWDPNLNQKMIDLEFWVLLHDRHVDTFWENAYLDVIIDWNDATGNLREETVFSASNLTLIPDNPNAIEWVPVHIDYLIPDAQPEEVSLHFIGSSSDPTEWTYIFIDGVDFESMCVPEPGSLALLALAGLPLLYRRR